MNKSELIAFTNLIISFLTLLIAFFALHSWKKQFNKSLLRDFVLNVYDSVHEMEQSNWKIIDYLNQYTENNIELIRDSSFFLNPIHIHKQELLENAKAVLSKLNHAINRLLGIYPDKNLRILCERYLECISEINTFFIETELAGYNNDFSNKNLENWTFSWLDKACDQEMLLQMQIEEKLLGLLKI